MHHYKLLGRAVGVALGILIAATAHAEDFKFTLASSGASTNYFPWFQARNISLSTHAPADVKTPPADLHEPLYGSLLIGPTEARTHVGIILDQPVSGPTRLFVDANGNGNYADDPPVTWTRHELPAKDKSGATAQYDGEAGVLVRYGSQVVTLNIRFYRLEAPNKSAAELPLFYYRDYARTGEVTVGEKKYRAALSDQLCRGDFRPVSGVKVSGVELCLDLNDDGKFSYASERFDLSQPFAVDGVRYRTVITSASGDTVKIVKMPIPVKFSGEQITSFAAKTLAGMPVTFPGDYAGKLVMLDFWATWCGPCMGEVPNVTAAYNQYHAQGFDILGVSLDDGKSNADLSSFLGGKGMIWPQVYEGGAWDTRLVKLFNVHSIPMAYLVDGDSGVILARGDELRGEQLSVLVAKYLAAKKGL